MLPREAAALSMYAEDAFYSIGFQNNKTPTISHNITKEWELIAYIFSKNDLLNRNRVIDSVYYGFIIKRGSEFAVVIRGTAKTVEWLIDAKVSLVKFNTHKTAKVSTGFISIYKHMYARFLDGKESKLVNALSEIDANNITVVGHSLGAAIGSYLVLDLHNEMNIKAKAFLFGMPRPGNKEYSDYFHSTVSEYCVYNYVHDIVQSVPPKFIGYHSLSNVQIIPENSIVKQNIAHIICSHLAVTYNMLLGSTIEKECLGILEREYCRACLNF